MNAVDTTATVAIPVIVKKAVETLDLQTNTTSLSLVLFLPTINAEVVVADDVAEFFIAAYRASMPPLQDRMQPVASQEEAQPVAPVPDPYKAGRAASAIGAPPVAGGRPL